MTRRTDRDDVASRRSAMPMAAVPQSTARGSTARRLSMQPPVAHVPVAQQVNPVERGAWDVDTSQDHLSAHHVPAHRVSVHNSLADTTQPSTIARGSNSRRNAHARSNEPVLSGHDPSSRSPLDITSGDATGVDNRALRPLLVCVSGNAATTTAIGLCATLPVQRARPCVLVEADALGGVVTAWLDDAEEHYRRRARRRGPISTRSGLTVVPLPAHPAEARHCVSFDDFFAPVIELLHAGYDAVIDLGRATDIAYGQQAHHWHGYDGTLSGGDITVPRPVDRTTESVRGSIIHSATAVHLATLRQDQRSLRAAAAGVHREVLTVASMSARDHRSALLQRRYDHVVLAVIGTRPFTFPAVANECHRAHSQLVDISPAAPSSRSSALLGGDVCPMPTERAGHDNTIDAATGTRAAAEPIRDGHLSIGDAAKGDHGRGGSYSIGLQHGGAWSTSPTHHGVHCASIADDPRTAALLAGRMQFTSRRWRTSRLRQSLLFVTESLGVLAAQRDTQRRVGRVHAAGTPPAKSHAGMSVTADSALSPSSSDLHLRIAQHEVNDER